MENVCTTERPTVQSENAEIKTPAKYRYVRAKDSRGRPIRAVWIRCNSYYIEYCYCGRTYKKILRRDGVKVSTPAEAIEARDAFERKLKTGQVATERVPNLEDYVRHYITWSEETEAKDELTILKERGHLAGWVKFLGNVKMATITRRQINDYAIQRKKAGASNRTINLDVGALRTLFKFAKNEGVIDFDPTVDWRPLKHVPPKRPLITAELVDALCAEATRAEGGKPVYENGVHLKDYLRLMQYSGARRNAAIQVKWSDVNFDLRQVTFHTKFDKAVTVDFNAELEAHLVDMRSRRKSERDRVFGDNCYQKTFELVRAEVAKTSPEAKVFTPHLLRHYFISWCVMSGLDFMTIARWVGHSDGGQLIGQVYGHLNAEHTQQAAKKLSFGLKGKLDLNQFTAAELLEALKLKTAA